MVVVTVSEITWESIKTRMTDRNTYQFEVYNLLMDQFEVFKAEDCKIILPKSVSVAERHKIHINTLPGFLPRSKGYAQDRIMELFIDANFFQELHDRFKPAEEVQETVQETTDEFTAFKKAVLDDIMQLVEKYFNDLFLKHYV